MSSVISLNNGFNVHIWARTEIVWTVLLIFGISLEALKLNVPGIIFSLNSNLTFMCRSVKTYQLFNHRFYEVIISIFYANSLPNHKLLIGTAGVFQLKQNQRKPKHVERLSAVNLISCLTTTYLRFCYDVYHLSSTELEKTKNKNYRFAFNSHGSQTVKPVQFRTRNQLIRHDVEREVFLFTFLLLHIAVWWIYCEESIRWK